MKPAVLLLSVYPYLTPRHGGQIRLRNIAKAYETAGWQVYGIALYDQNSYHKETAGPLDIPFSSEPIWRQFKGSAIPLVDDFLSGLYAESDDGGFPLILKNIPRQINAIHVEQPWLWRLARKIQNSRLPGETILIYGSQNIETPLKREILSNYRIYHEEILSAIEALERQAAQEADLTLAVTQYDADLLSQYGAKSILVAPNGVEPWYADEEDIEQWRRSLPKSPWLLYIASAHPPNFTGFTEIVGESLAFIPPDSRLVVAGNVSEHIGRVLKETRWNHLNTSRLQLLNILADNDLAAVKELAHIFILPISHGGGSNIKTAEAIYSGSFVVGTRAAFRGYENFLHLPEIAVTDTPFEFRSAIQRALQQPAAPKARKIEGRQSLLWEKCLASIPERVDVIMREKYEK